MSVTKALMSSSLVAALSFAMMMTLLASQVVEANEQAMTASPIILNSGGQTVSGSVSSGTWQYYVIYVDPLSSMTVTLKSSNQISLYMKSNSQPTSYNYDYVLMYSGEQKSILTLKNQTSNVPYYFGVYGRGSFSNSFSFDVSVTTVEGLANWIIGLIVAGVIIVLVCSILSVLIPVLVCCGVLTCCGFGAAAAASSSGGSSGGATRYHHVHNNVVYTDTQPILQQQQPPQYYQQPQQF
ncbi:hypothetical protein C9374_008633 [Naegleria lovaniensis]|uniref:Uncharacterized protein n=1 Tax=Naegleria lovaniensis TaxID=51637 RepID=A0AA88KHB3_NAELO|nr:uncharacterized protein C9374_008633 [Naegleria lovaniensis]KAG2378011.1 hypothetical protein C9374_008633 [Naegleria lovaniensis]